MFPEAVHPKVDQGTAPGCSVWMNAVVLLLESFCMIIHFVAILLDL